MHFYRIPFVRIGECRCRSLQKRNLERSAPEFPKSDRRIAIKNNFEGGRIFGNSQEIPDLWECQVHFGDGHVSTSYRPAERSEAWTCSWGPEVQLFLFGLTWGREYLNIRIAQTTTLNCSNHCFNNAVESFAQRVQNAPILDISLRTPQ